MGQAKQALIDLSGHLQGAVGHVALAGGYLYIYVDDRLIHISSIPSPNVFADWSSESVVENVDQFEDESGNEFVIAISSSMKGIEWSLKAYPDDTHLLMRLHYDVSLNEN